MSLNICKTRRCTW